MLDLARLVALVVALYSSVRARSVAGVAAGAFIAVIDAAFMLAPIAFRTAPPDAGHAFVLAFWGPSKMPMPATSMAWVDVALVRYPMVVPLITGSMAAAAAIRAFRIAAPMRPESDLARTYDQIGLRFLFVAVLDGILVVMDSMASHFVSNVV